MNVVSIPAARLSPAICALMLAVPAATAASMLWDLKADWSNISNPNGPWSYNEGNNALPYIGSWPLGPGQDGWGESSPPLPFWFRATSSPMGVEWQAGDIMVHTQDEANGAGNGPANVTWTSPFSGTISVTGSAWMEDDFGDRGNRWNIYFNGQLRAHGFLSGTDPYTRAVPFLFADGSLEGPGALTDIPVGVGDVVRLEYIRTSTFGYFVGTELAITGTIPEPSSVALTGLGAVLLHGALRRLRRIRRGETPIK